MKFTLCWLAAATLFATSAWAFTGGPKEDPGPRSSPSPYAEKPLPEIKGVVSWKTLAEVTAVKQKDKFVPSFSKSITQLDKTEVRLQGFMLPLEPGERQKSFILSAMPPSCAFCMPGGPDAIVEVKAKTPIKYGYEPVVISGRFVVLRDDPTGLFYRLTDAVVVGGK